MPYVLRHEQTGEIAAAIMRNKYDLDYYGVQWWPVKEEAEAAAAPQPGWTVVQVAESRLKLMNVKLNNDAGRKLFVDDNETLRIEEGSAR